MQSGLAGVPTAGGAQTGSMRVKGARMGVRRNETGYIESIRRHSVVTLEEGVRQLTDVPARLYGLRDRGRLEEGWYGDVVVFDPESVDCGPTYTRFDLPTGAGRLYADAAGVDHVIVNGVEIVQKGEHTGALPGTILRSGRDTDTVEVPGGRNPGGGS